MNWERAILWGFVATIILTTIMSAGQGLRLTRMNISFMLGTMFTQDRDRAKWIGFVVHLINGWIFAIIYAAAFHQTGIVSAWFGSLIGLVHSLFVLSAGVGLLPAIHPRMASEQRGPDPTRMLEPPGFLMLNYGRETPFVTILAHLVYGGVIGHFYAIKF